MNSNSYAEPKKLNLDGNIGAIDLAEALIKKSGGKRITSLYKIMFEEKIYYVTTTVTSEEDWESGVGRQEADTV